MASSNGGSQNILRAKLRRRPLPARIDVRRSDATSRAASAAFRLDAVALSLSLDAFPVASFDSRLQEKVKPSRSEGRKTFRFPISFRKYERSSLSNAAVYCPSRNRKSYNYRKRGARVQPSGK